MGTRGHGRTDSCRDEVTTRLDVLEAAELRLRRMALGLSQRQLAQILGVTPTTLARWERNEQRVGNPVLVRLALDQLNSRRPDTGLASRQPSTGARQGPGRDRRLPVEPTSFVGREQELEELTALLPTTRLMTLTGPGGVGKTRLALRLAALVQGDFTDGVCIVELSALVSPELLTDEVACAVEIPMQSGRSKLEGLIAHLRGCELLLVLDNCEHLAQACAELASALLPRCPGLRILATSRTVLRATAELVWEVPGLDLPQRDAPITALPERSSAVRLFMERACAARRGFGSFSDHAPAIIELCYRLDGLPLALELAAARLSVLTPAQLASRLGDTFELLVDGPRDAPARQRTLRATLDWSYRLVADNDRTLLARLSVFAGGATLPAVEAVCGLADATGIVDSLDRLIAASLVQRLNGPECAPRFSLLETIRAYAAERLRERGESQTLRERHALYYATLPADPMHDTWGPRPGEAARHLQPEADNLRAAAMWACETGRVDVGFTLVWGLGIPRDAWNRRGARGSSSFREVVSWGETFLALDRQLLGHPTPARARAMVATGYNTLFEGRTERARTLVIQAQAEFEQLDDTVGQAYAFQILACIQQYAGDPVGAEVCGRRALDLATRVDASHILTWAPVTLGVVSAQQGRLEEGREFLEQALARARRTGEAHVIPRALLSLGSIHCRRSAPDAAAEVYRAAVQLGIDDDDPAALMLALDGLARVAYLRGDLMRAGRLLGAVNGLWHDMEYTVVRNPYDPASHDDLLLHLRDAMGRGCFNRMILAGEVAPLQDIVSEALQDGSFGDDTRPLPSSIPVMTAREREVADLVARGLSNRQIAELLVVSQRTVESHVSNILHRLDLTSRVQLGVWSATRTSAASTRRGWTGGR